MNITFDENRRVFSFDCAEMSYAIAIANDGRLVNLYWGGAVSDVADYEDVREVLVADMNPYFGMTTRPEYRSVEAFDYGVPCLRATLSDGAQTLRLRYVGHAIDGDTLRIVERDEFYPIEVELIYKTWGELPLIGKTAVIRNLGGESIRLNSAMSACLHLPACRKWRLTHYAGHNSAEYQRMRQEVTQSRIELQTNRLTMSGAQAVPFFALDENGASTESSGEVFFGVLHWSGDFRITIDNQYGNYCSVVGGVNDYTAEIPLAAGESFETPMLTAGYSSRGFERTSEVLYDLQLDYLLPRGEKREKAHGVFPIIYNSWYPYLFDVSEEKLISLIPKVKEVGAELLVVDDGWMPGRVNSKIGLGDWVADPERFPSGLGAIADACHREGLLFGLWVEPEMVDPDSDLYRTHPDWVLSEPNRERTLFRSQCILDMSRDDITEWAIGWLDELIIGARLDYLKWDMNRSVSEVGLYARERGVTVKYIKNVMRIWEHLNERFPDLLLENCAAGGGRADFGMVRLSDRINRSDNADPVDVIKLHEGFTTFFVPKLAGGAGNVAPSPYRGSREVPLEYRIHLGMTGSMSIGVDLLRASEEEIKELRAATDDFKRIRGDLQNSYVYRIASPWDNPYAVFEYCTRDRGSFTVFAFGHGLNRWNYHMPRFKMRGLLPDAIYECGGVRMSGRALMNIGVNVSLMDKYVGCDYVSRVMTFTRVK